MLNLLADLRQRLGLTMLFVAHNMAVVRHVCDRVAVMYLGRIVETAPSEQLFSDARHPYTQALLRAVPRLAPGHVTVRDAVVGDPPSPVNLPPGCRFNPRCPRAEEVCREHDPPLELPRRPRRRLSLRLDRSREGAVRVFISSDIEGTAGIVHWEQVLNGPEYEGGRDAARERGQRRDRRRRRRRARRRSSSTTPTT